MIKEFSRVLRGAQSSHAVKLLCAGSALLTLLACTAPRQFGRSSSTPMPSALGGSPMASPRAPTMLRAVRPVRFAPPLYADQTKEGEPWSGLQLAMQAAPQGILVGNVSHDSPAELAGIQAGDYIFQLDGRTVRDALEVLAEIGRVGVGGSLRLGVHRAERVRLFRVEPVARPPEAAASAATADTPRQPVALDDGVPPASPN